MADEKDLSQFQQTANAFFRTQESNEAAKLKLGKLKKKADAWAAQEKADIDSGVKKPPASSLEKFMADKEYTDFGDQKNFKSNMPAAAESRMMAHNKPLKTALVREVEPGRSRNLEAKMLSKFKSQLEPDMKQDIKLQSAAETGEAQAFVGKLKPGLEQRTAAHTLQSREFPRTTSGVFGAGRKDLGRSVVNVIKSEVGKADGGSLMKLAKKRQLEGKSIAGKPGNMDGNRNRLSAQLKGLGKVGSKLGGKLGVYGTGKMIIEGADTLQKLKSGTHGLTPEGTAKLKKGLIES